MVIFICMENKKIRLSESKLISLIKKIINEVDTSGERREVEVSNGDIYIGNTKYELQQDNWMSVRIPVIEFNMITGSYQLKHPISGSIISGQFNDKTKLNDILSQLKSGKDKIGLVALKKDPKTNQSEKINLKFVKS